MTAGAIIAIAVAAVVVLGAIAFLTAVRRQDVRGAGALSRETRSKDRAAPAGLPDAPTGREVERAVAQAQSAALVPAAPAPVAPWTPPDPDAVGVSRRQFFNRATVTLMSASLAGFGAAVVGFLWKGAEGGFGSRVNAGRLSEVINNIRANDGFLYIAEGRAWVTEYPAGSLGKARESYPGPVLTGMEGGVVALYQKCPHLGCRVPECKSSQWFECQCHGSQYNRVGEKKAGPAPRGMDLFAMQITPAGDLIIDTGTIFNGMPVGTNTTGQEAEGPNCTGGGDH
jgi:cytochrome b6-f complex iron-sulfur subunit